MLEREILVANTKTQKRSKLITSATTLGELKEAMANEGIDFSGLEFTEGITKTQLLDDASLLPTNIPYKGGFTNNLVILLTNTKKKIDSGNDNVTMTDRFEAYNVIKENNLQDAIKEYFGRNFTQVSTANLWEFINDKDMDSDDKNADYDDEDTDMELTPVVVILADLIEALVEDEVLSEYDVDDLCSLISKDGSVKKKAYEAISSSDGKITNEDINKMIDSLQ